MRLPVLKFPQTTRLFSAPLFSSIFTWSERVLLFSFLIGIFAYNTITYAHFLPILDVTSVLSRPFSSTIHTGLATTLWLAGYPNWAKREARIAAELNGDASHTSVLGANTDPTSLLKKWEERPVRIKDELRYWETVVQTHPDYRDAYYHMGVLWYELGNISEAKKMIEVAHALDPNFLPAETMLTKVLR